MNNLPTLALLRQRLVALQGAQTLPAGSYAVPGLWIDPLGSPAAQQVDPYAFYRERVSTIAALPAEPLIDGLPGGDWSLTAVVYNCFVRATTAFDHDGDGELAVGANAQGWRETGTFLKCLALLPYLRSLGINTIYFLPVTAVGEDGKKGSLGSPYAIRNPYLLDENLSEPALGVGAEVEFKALVEAAHHLGIRIVLEFVFRTAARDADWVAEHPDWFYWIDARVPEPAAGIPAAVTGRGFGPPHFEEEELGFIFGEAAAGRFDRLIPPPADYCGLYTPVPAADRIEKVKGRWQGRLADGRRVRIPSAFSDWPSDRQPPWTDVTYLRLYAHADFNYMAYNTLRLYDERLAQPEHIVEPLWAHITGIIPYYQTEYDIDGVMIDMGHALPSELKRRIVQAARAGKPDFAFWAENFGSAADSRAEGYNAILERFAGALHIQAEATRYLAQLSAEGMPLPFMAMPETHDMARAAARAGGLAYSRYAWAVCAILPALPVVHSGFELAETAPLNTGIGFSAEEIARYPTATLGLFNPTAYRWTAVDTLVPWVRRVLAARARRAALIADPDPASFTFAPVPDNPVIFVFTRGARGAQAGLIVIANSDYYNNQMLELVLPGAPDLLHDLLADKTYLLDDAHCLRVELAPAQVLWFER